MTTEPFSPTPVRRSNNHFVPRPNEGVWPGLATPPRAPGKARIAEALFRQAVKPLPVRVVFPGGERIGSGGPDSPVMRIVRPDAFFHRLGAGSKIGFGESYMVGDWTTTELADLLAPFAAKMATLIPPVLQRIGRRFAEARQPSEEVNTVEGSRENIHRHYDLSNDLFATFLDETMSYSAGWFADGSDDLVLAQERKIDGILDMAGVGPDSHVLEIGTGWGGLATRAAQRGARVTTLTISAEQAKLAEQRLEAAGVADRVQVLLRDYREAQGSYDAVVSVEMIEAVGVAYWPTYFAALDRLLKPGGKVGLQSITMPHDRMLVSQDDYTWISKYVFPGGVIPSIEAIEQNLRDHTGLRIAERRSLGPDYARTLAHWRRTFLDRWETVAGLGFDETFRRMWEFYLAYCEAGFRVGYLDVHQLSLQHRRPY
ncbi:class I SAM-dependent methyltransferase [Pseudonocardia sp. KRD-184]|uniref:Class I SAM-dependent methyltransferase n=1 Tax=Pseudonocardia oceani TaxID=2792013 RepID=A0ABS6UDZ3_9PSEU|nr:cyclopropane-fatty-acyl-phospholipid synthase family protein [Pseudonocardia oceani]MBW0088195.1 class I SAM-dependent methyltransferase [Pseudonocardia oceani]MBW0094834.1 class I SAM-dependent methyltransferase [Pseudonocardia oceani]MBW0107612.1 class I SAM-dependent methyltransferase [Pseudonocardia oceani]MBW0121005.1 class I SAM-dependent methyltransferase [Pseudonocardia oceani]MBW0130456.1 class I SAM-dependent methyltransferase [Pseudonocardia oceani]